MSERMKQIRGLRRVLVFLTAWNAWVWVMAGWGFVCGGFVLLWRVLEHPLSELIPFVAAGMICIVVGVALFSLRKRPSIKSVAALMDARLKGGGLIMAAESGAAQGWAYSVKTLSPRWRGRVPSLFFLAAFVFLGLAFIIPISDKIQQIDRPLEIQALVETLEERVELLEELGVIKEEQAKEWLELTDALEQQSSGKNPAATWEALDQLSKRIEETAAIEMQDRRWEVEKREELVAALKAAMQAYDKNKEAADAARKELSDALKKMAKTNPNLQQLLNELPSFRMGAAVAASCLTKEEVKMLAKRLSKMTKEDLERMQKMVQKGMCASGACNQAGSAESLKKFLAEHPGCTNLALCAGMSVCPGGSGVSRGPGVAPISWLGNTSEEGVSFKEEVLPSSRLTSFKNSELLGESFGAPEVDVTAKGSTGGSLKNVKKSDSSATVYAVLPRHRKSVKRFFKREKEE